MLDNVDLLMSMKFQKVLMTGCRDMDKKHQKCPENEDFLSFMTPQDFFSKTQNSHDALSSCKKLEKSNERSLRDLETDQRNNGQGSLHGTPSDKPKI